MKNAMDCVKEFCDELNVKSLFDNDVPKYEFFKNKLMEKFQNIASCFYQNGLDETKKNAVTHEFFESAKELSRRILKFNAYLLGSTNEELNAARQFLFEGNVEAITRFEKALGKDVGNLKNNNADDADEPFDFADTEPDSDSGW